jgi:hypothetical protein
LKHLDAIIVTYKKRRIKNLKYVSEKLAKTHEKTLENHCKHRQHLDKKLAIYVENIYNIQINTLVTYVWKNR